MCIEAIDSRILTALSAQRPDGLLRKCKCVGQQQRCTQAKSSSLTTTPTFQDNGFQNFSNSNASFHYKETGTHAGKDKTRVS